MCKNCPEGQKYVYHVRFGGEVIDENIVYQEREQEQGVFRIRNLGNGEIIFKAVSRLRWRDGGADADDRGMSAWNWTDELVRKNRAAGKTKGLQGLDTGYVPEKRMGGEEITVKSAEAKIISVGTREVAKTVDTNSRSEFCLTPEDSRFGVIVAGLQRLGGKEHRSQDGSIHTVLHCQLTEDGRGEMMMVIIQGGDGDNPRVNVLDNGGKNFKVEGLNQVNDEVVFRPLGSDTFSVGEVNKTMRRLIRLFGSEMAEFSGRKDDQNFTKVWEPIKAEGAVDAKGPTRPLIVTGGDSLEQRFAVEKVRIKADRGLLDRVRDQLIESRQDIDGVVTIGGISVSIRVSRSADWGILVVTMGGRLFNVHAVGSEPAVWEKFEDGSSRNNPDVEQQVIGAIRSVVGETLS